MLGKKEVIEMDIWKTPESLGSGNVAFDVFLRVAVRNTVFSLTAVSPWGNKCSVRSYLPRRLRKRPCMN